MCIYLIYIYIYTYLYVHSIHFLVLYLMIYHRHDIHMTCSYFTFTHGARAQSGRSRFAFLGRVYLFAGIRFLKHQTHPKMRWDLSLKCSALRKVGFFIHFFHNGQNFQNPTPFQCHILHFNVAKFWISTSVVANGQFQSCTVQSWGCDWSGFKKDPLQDTQGLRDPLRFGHRNCARFQLFCLHDIADIHDSFIFHGHWDIGYSLMWSILAAALFDILVSFPTNSLEPVLHSFQIWVLHSCFWTFAVWRWISAHLVESWRRHR